MLFTVRCRLVTIVERLKNSCFLGLSASLNFEVLGRALTLVFDEFLQWTKIIIQRINEKRPRLWSRQISTRDRTRGPRFSIFGYRSPKKSLVQTVTRLFGSLRFGDWTWVYRVDDDGAVQWQGSDKVLFWRVHCSRSWKHGPGAKPWKRRLHIEFLKSETINIFQKLEPKITTLLNGMPLAFATRMTLL